MAGSDTLTVDEYIANLPPERQASISAVRDAVRRNLRLDMKREYSLG
ncbi:hypothetical protein BH24CHL7_BH24CHL7_07270 [soil metagenome]